MVETSPVWRYRIAGLVVQSEFALPGIAEAIDTDPDVVITLAPVPTGLNDVILSKPRWQIGTEERFLMLGDDVRLLIREGRRIDVELTKGTPIAEAVAYILATGMGVIAMQRRKFVLHASAVAIDGRAVAFSASSGTGKSTLAAAMVRAGYPFMTDDVSVIDFDAADQPFLYPDARAMKLHTDAIDHLGLHDETGGRLVKNTAKFYVTPGQRVTTATLPLRAIHILEAVPSPMPLTITRLGQLPANILLRHNSYRPHLIGPMGLKSTYFQAGTMICRSCPVFQTRIPRDLAALDRLITHFRAFGPEAEL